MKRKKEVMDPALQVNVGRRIRQLRTDSSFSIRALAEKSGLNFNTLSLIENGKTSPSVNTLQQIAAALQIPITAFFETEGQQQLIVHQVSGSRSSSRFTNGSLQDLGGGITLNGGRLMLLALDPGAGEAPETLVHTGQEFVFCLEGNLEYRVNGQSCLLAPGDSLIFEAHLPHGWRNPGPGQARFLLILCPSDQNDRPDQRHFLAEASPRRSVP